MRKVHHVVHRPQEIIFICASIRWQVDDRWMKAMAAELLEEVERVVTRSVFLISEAWLPHFGYRQGRQRPACGCEMDDGGKKNAFVASTREKWEYNQYWYSPHTIAVMAKEIEEHATKVAFLSTPSVWFSLKSGELKQCSFFFDVDVQWARFPNFVKWDYNQPEEIDPKMHHAFDCVVIDPPFITPEVWAKYAEAAQLLLSDGGKIILSTIRENAGLLKQILQVEPQVFQPSIPHLVYQYAFFTNYPSTYFSSPNPEIS